MLCFISEKIGLYWDGKDNQKYYFRIEFWLAFIRH